MTVLKLYIFTIILTLKLHHDLQHTQWLCNLTRLHMGSAPLYLPR